MLSVFIRWVVWCGRLLLVVSVAMYGMYKGNVEAVCETIVAIKTIIVTYSECMSVAFIIQRAKRM